MLRAVDVRFRYELRGLFMTACGKARPEGGLLHDLRHLCVTMLFRARVPARSIQEPAGHANLTTTQRYAPVVAKNLEDAVRRLGQRAGNKLD